MIINKKKHINTIKNKTYKNKYTNKRNNITKKINKIFKSGNIDFNKVEIIKKIGIGLNGTTYLVKYNNKQYALKIQHIIYEDIHKGYKSALIRELDFYKYIDKLSEKNQLIFAKLYGYEIYNKCKHKQERQVILDFEDEKNKIAQRQKALDNSEWCIKYLIDFKGEDNLLNFITKNTNKLTSKNICSFCLQICNIIYTLYKSGYSHNDLHLGNIMIQKTKLKYFNLMNKQIPYEGYILSAIDYGRVFHKKYNLINQYTEVFLKNRELFMFNEIFERTFVLFNNMKILDNECRNKLKIDKQEMENKKKYAFIKILYNQPIFYNNIKIKYSKYFPKGKTIFKKMDKFIIESKINLKDLNEDEKDIYYRVLTELIINYPNDFIKFYELNNYTYKSFLDTNTILNLLIINNHKDYINYLIEKINNEK